MSGLCSPIFHFLFPLLKGPVDIETVDPAVVEADDVVDIAVDIEIDDPVDVEFCQYDP